MPFFQIFSAPMRRSRRVEQSNHRMKLSELGRRLAWGLASTRLAPQLMRER
jgi:hypothetical protein